MIPIKNIYYMLAYAFQTLNAKGFRSIATEEFNNTGELFAAILIKGVSLQVKRGLGKEYIEKQDTLSTLQGKIDISDSLKKMTMQKRQLVCIFDDFSVNSKLNQILKSTMELLLKQDISKAKKKELRKVLVYFNDVDTIDLHSVDWNIRYDRNNQTYRMLISICNLVVKGLLQTQSDGSTKLMEYIDEQRMCRLYEKFILEYYRKEHPELTANASKIEWQLDNSSSDLLPAMKTDIMLTKGDTVLIIDAKYYAHTLQSQFDVQTLHSGNLYQIFTYVKNKDYELKDNPHRVVSGMLLYAKTDEEKTINKTYYMSKNRISAKTLDLDCDFDRIKNQLEEIVSEHFQ